MRSRFAGVAIAVIVTAAAAPSFAQQQPHNVILFIADGLRPGMVNEQTAPALAGLMQQGLHFTNTHAMFPAFTMANAASMATGHKVSTPGLSATRSMPDFPCQAPATALPRSWKAIRCLATSTSISPAIISIRRRSCAPPARPA
jgi:hypothetical protein